LNELEESSAGQDGVDDEDPGRRGSARVDPHHT